ncbi:MAG: hypothetical protein IT436_08115 [Phycisphaerales bacterium]|nr:hypothetical protein [Phycisphaerales bacterium]
MGRGQTFHNGNTGGFTKAELLEASGLSAKTFDMIRKAARVKGPSHGGLNWMFTREDVRALVHCAGGGRFTERGPGPAAAWERLLNGEDAADGVDE